MTGSVDPYLNLLAGQHRNKPNYIASITAALQPLADLIQNIGLLTGQFDLDSAAGEQLDFIGQWVGVTRNLKVPVGGTYFSFDTAGVGFDAGLWKGPFDPDTGLVSLPDTQYRTLIKARILNNIWDGSIPNAYAIWDTLFATTGYTLFIVDNGDLTMDLGLIGTVPIDALTLALFEGGYLDVKPAGVRIRNYLTPSISGPLFAFDQNTSSFAGFDTGVWAKLTPAS